MNIKHLSDSQLVQDARFLVKQELKCQVAILTYIIEIESRKLFCEYKYPSMLDFIVHELGYSLGAASRRLQTSRLMREIPEIKPRITQGALSICILYKAANFFRREKINETSIKATIISKLEFKTALECEKILLELTAKPLPSESIRQVSQNHVQLKINVLESTHKKLDDLKCLLGLHMIDDEFFSSISDEAKENIIRKRFKLTRKGRETHSTTRTPSNHDRRTAYEQAKEKTCENCGGLFLLQEDHREPYALGGSSKASNLRLLCFHCNQRARINSGL
jgi:hypothetical protein